jgi:hypothetical protein
MNINWYSFYHKIRTLSIIALTLCLLSVVVDIYLGEDNMFGTSPYDSVPYAVIAFLVSAFSWMMVIKYKSHRGVPEVTSKKASRLYGTIAIVLIAIFLLALAILPRIANN